jgi:hypothetical protein
MTFEYSDWLPIMDMNNDVSHSIANTCTRLGTTQNRKEESKGKVLNKMGPKSLNIFSYKSEKTNYNLREISSDFSLPNRAITI